MYFIPIYFENGEKASDPINVTFTKLSILKLHQCTNNIFYMLHSSWHSSCTDIPSYWCLIKLNKDLCNTWVSNGPILIPNSTTYAFKVLQTSLSFSCFYNVDTPFIEIAMYLFTLFKLNFLQIWTNARFNLNSTSNHWWSLPCIAVKYKIKHIRGDTWAANSRSFVVFINISIFHV